MAVSALFLAAVLLIVVIVVVVIVVLVLGRNRSQAQAATPAFPPPGPSMPDSREERSAILKQLANKEISKEEAEAKMADLGGPVPQDFPPPPPPPQRSSSSGCILALVITLVVVVVVLVFGVLAMIGLRATTMDMQRSHIEQLTPSPQMIETSEGRTVILHGGNQEISLEKVEENP